MFCSTSVQLSAASSLQVCVLVAGFVQGLQGFGVHGLLLPIAHHAPITATFKLLNFACKRRRRRRRERGENMNILNYQFPPPSIHIPIDCKALVAATLTSEKSLRDKYFSCDAAPVACVCVGGRWGAIIRVLNKIGYFTLR